MAMIITFVFLFCIISCAPASHGVEMDGATFVGNVVKGTAKQLDAQAIKTGQLLQKSYTVDQATDPILQKSYIVDQATDPIPKAERKLQGILQGTAITGLQWPAIAISTSLNACKQVNCVKFGENKGEKDEGCRFYGCTECVPDDIAEFCE